jgi:hypothetical protein
MDGIRDIVRALQASGIAGELWVDGSFLTEKIEPRDSDIVFCCDPMRGFDTSNPDHRSVVNWINSNLKASHLCDSYVNVVMPPGYPGSIPGRAYWQRQFGLSRGSMNKGIAVIVLP